MQSDKYSKENAAISVGRNTRSQTRFLSCLLAGGEFEVHYLNFWH